MTQTSVADPLAKQPRKLHRFAVGDVCAGVTILRILNPDDAMEERRYWARWACCGRLGEVLHRSLRSRMNNGTRTCAACQRPAEDRAAEILARRATARALAMSGAWR